EIGEQQPRIAIALVPACEQRAIEATARPLKRRARAHPLRAGLRHQLVQWLIVTTLRWPKRSPHINPKKWMPAQAHDTLKKPAPIQAPIGQDDHKEPAGHHG